MSPSSCGLPRFTSLPPRLQRPQTWLYGRGVLLFPWGSLLRGGALTRPSPSSRLQRSQVPAEAPIWRGGLGIAGPDSARPGRPAAQGRPPRGLLGLRARLVSPSALGPPACFLRPPPPCLSWVQGQAPSHCPRGGAARIPRLWGTALAPTWLGGPRAGRVCPPSPPRSGCMSVGKESEVGGSSFLEL